MAEAETDPYVEQEVRRYLRDTVDSEDPTELERIAQELQRNLGSFEHGPEFGRRLIKQLRRRARLRRN